MKKGPRAVHGYGAGHHGYLPPYQHLRQNAGDASYLKAVDDAPDPTDRSGDTFGFLFHRSAGHHPFQGHDAILRHDADMVAGGLKAEVAHEGPFYSGVYLRVRSWRLKLRQRVPFFQR